MCGIIGFSGNNKFEKNLIKLLYTHNSLERGEDAIGMYSPLNKLFKKSGKPVTILPTMDIIEDNIFIGHVRSATVGINNDANAHPFQFGNLVGLMNGTITNIKDLCAKYNLDHKNFKVDSEALFAIIEKEGNFTVLSEVVGGCAVLVMDTTLPDTMYVFRNYERPLFKGYLNGDMYISSIDDSLKIIGCTSIDSFTCNHLYTIVNGVIGDDNYIAPKPYIVEKEFDLSGSQGAPSYDKMKGKYLKSRWVKFDSPFNTAYKEVVPSFTNNMWYLCVGFVSNNDTEIVVKDNNNKNRIISYSCFSWHASFPTKNYPMKILEDITYEKGKRVLFKKDDIVFFNKYIPSKRLIFVLKSKDAESGWTFDQSLVRPLDYMEKQAYERECNNESCNTSNNTLFNSPFHNTNFNGNTSETELVVDSETPVDNKDTYISINEEECISYFEGLQWRLSILKSNIEQLLFTKSQKAVLNDLVNEMETDSEEFVKNHIDIIDKDGGIKE